ncbi:MAG: YeeE/YedE family protein [Deltaproteobacteria bacterium]|nr:YeeE/YedE family protein [Deltaproteobacteria bacterium]
MILNDLTPLHWAVAGLGIGLVTLALLFLAGQRLGVSTGFESICGLLLRVPYLQRPEIRSSRGYRLPFTAGLVLGGLLSAVLGGGWAPTWELGMLDDAIHASPAAKLAWMFAGGLLIGFGTRLAGGCTSGHGIFGISSGDRSSIVSTLAFMAAGAFVTNIVYRLLVGAAP